MLKYWINLIYKNVGRKDRADGRTDGPGGKKDRADGPGGRKDRAEGRTDRAEGRTDNRQ